MSNKIKCPFCQTELEQMHDKKLLGCPKCLHIADGAFWAKAVQAKQDLETAQEALEKLIYEYNRCRRDEFEGVDIDWEWWVMAAKNTVETALKQIKHKE